MTTRVAAVLAGSADIPLATSLHVKSPRRLTGPTVRDNPLVRCYVYNATFGMDRED